MLGKGRAEVQSTLTLGATSLPGRRPTARSLVALCLAALQLGACAKTVRPAGYSEGGAAQGAASKPEGGGAPPLSATAAQPAGSRAEPLPAASTPPPASPPPQTPAPAGWSFGVGALRLEAASPTGSWFAYCTAPKPSDAPTLDARGSAVGPLRVVLATARGERDIGALLASDPAGRWLVALEPGEGQGAANVPLLVDTATDRRFPLTSLSPDLRSDGLPEHRSFAFSRSGTELFLLDGEGRGVLLTLSDGEPLSSARRVSLPGDAPYRVESSADSFVILTVPAGRAPAKWPSAQAKEPPLRCRSRGLSAYSALSGPLPDPNVRYLLLGPNDRKVTSLSAVAAPGYVQGFRGGWVRRTDAGELLLVANGQQKRIASSRCGARILEADERTGWFLIACEEYRPVKPAPVKVKPGRRPPPPKLRFPLYLARPGGLRDLELETMRTGTDVPSRSVERYVALHVDGRPVLVDLEQGTPRLLDASQRVLTTTASGALLRDGEGLSFVGQAGSRTLAERAPALSRLQLARAFVAFDALVLQLTADGVTSSHLAAPPLHLTPTGHALVPKKAETESAWAVGPVSIQVLAEGEPGAPLRLHDLDGELDRLEADIQSVEPSRRSAASD